MSDPQPQSPEHDFDIGRRLTALAIGIDQLERRLSKGRGTLDSEGLVPIYLGSDLVQPAEYSSWEEAHEWLEGLEQEARSYPAGPRQRFLLDMIDSLRAAVQLFSGQDLSFAEKLKRLVGVPAEPIEPERLEALQSELDSLLSGLGYRQGTLAERAARWEEERFVESDQLEPLFQRFMAEAQRRTDERVFPTGDYSMRLNLVQDVPYSARCNFEQGQMDLNADLRFTPSGLKHLVCHEVFPGHSTQLLYTLEAARRGESTPDVLLCTANTVVGAIQEGIGDQGIHLIDWIETPDDAIYLTLRRLRTAAATSAAWYQMAEGWPLEKVRGFLQETAFPQETWLEGRLRFAAHPFRGPFIASYWFGDEAVREARERAGKRQAEFVRFLYGTMNSVESMRMWA
ncbi:hypothetical protein [Meiothermus sp. Pnk-1]|uniref:hypothetical protein n=1 Tax=Meiothermus sp. Pnk-1 TaxID=873128 RepID=UPI000D7C1B73|nr:hypothetical protein [Meiothermus sp. Pnk-1]PZA07498.1 hypothetical protein DNA98_07700 [Meiothermus sp. Pnk-1]